MKRLTTFQVGTPATREQGLRIGVTRRPPRGVSRARWALDDYFDVWFPYLAPSEALIKRFRAKIDDEKARRQFFDAYEKELMRSAESKQAVELLAAVSLRTPVSLGRFCEDETRCHRSRLFEVVRREAERLADTGRKG
jgi:uncharacterized protein YeaO (DUF488 family)